MKRRFVTEEMKAKMREMEAAGKPRKAIAEALDVEPPTVTRHLGAVRQYRGLRLPRAIVE